MCFSSFATHLLCPVSAPANDTGRPSVGKTGTTLKPPERRDSGTDTQGKSPPSGSPIASNSEKVNPLFLLNSFQWVFFLLFIKSIVKANLLLLFEVHCYFRLVIVLCIFQLFHIRGIL